ncbi:MAG: CoA transferase [Aurantimonas sp.]|jgi:crotonobetainyl-CoA:carnitine CoA-transferase CaiB-like acyl-CoA transferase|nr:CoA transferase [Aurantimonas sp.]MAQ45486.1 CoA transferase [Actibacterium sp.]MAQ45511.1 CoA transferase [Actibacterium sp.]|tara:strand:- start:191 stop:1420 length:1230 start_codon:yes stop_codon:yes gene_type:complete
MGGQVLLLDGIKVVSFCHFLQGPAAAQYLADMGADVIKVEPVAGAHERHWSGAKVFVEGVSGFYLCANRNKRSIGIDLKSEGGREIALRLIAEADVVMENFRPGVFARLGFSEDEMRRVNPNVIFASASGFGSSGPMVGRPGQDILIQAASGMISATGAPSRGATAVGAAVCDQHGGALMAVGILGALLKRERGGKPTRVESSLLNSGIDLQTEPLVNYFAGNLGRDRFDRDENLATWFHEAPYGVYPARDGDMVISLCTDTALAEALSSDTLRGLVGHDRYEERDAFAAAVRDATHTMTLAELSARFDEHGVWYSPVQTYDDLADDPQIAHCEVFRDVEVRGRKVRLVNHPNRYDGQVPELRFMALEIGEHTREIMTEIGYAGEEIDGMLARGAVVEPAGEALEKRVV